MAAIVCVSPFATLVEVVETAIEERTGGTTVSVTDAVRVPTPAVSVVVP